MKFTNLDITKDNLAEALGITAERQFRLEKQIDKLTDDFIDELNAKTEANKTKFENEDNSKKRMELVKEHLNFLMYQTSKANLMSMYAELAETNAELAWVTAQALNFGKKIEKYIEAKMDDIEKKSGVEKILEGLRKIID